MVLLASEGLDKSWILVSKSALKDIELREEPKSAICEQCVFTNSYLQVANNQKQFAYFRAISDDFSKRVAKVWITSSLETLACTSSSIVKRFEAIDWSQPNHVKIAVQSAIDKLFCSDLISCESYRKYLDEVSASSEGDLLLPPFFRAWNEARDNVLRECELELKNRSLVLRGCGALAFLGSAAFSLQFVLPSQEGHRASKEREFSYWGVAAMSLSLFSLFRTAIYYTFLPSAVKECTPPKLFLVE